MSDKIAEGLSALLDNEASELDVRRLTRDMTDDDLKTWQNMCAVKSMLHKEESVFSSVNLLDGIRAGIENENMGDAVIEDQPAPQVVSGWKSWIGGVGVAAAVAMAVVGIGLQTDQFSGSGEAQIVSNDKPAVETTEKPKTAGVTRLAASDMTPEQYKALQDKLRSYMQHHAENSSDGSLGDVMPYARVVSFEVEDKSSK